MINNKLNVDDAQEIRNTNHHKNLFSFSFGEIKLRERIIDKGFKFVNKYYEYSSHFDKFEKIINTY